MYEESDEIVRWMMETS